ncbi:sensor histidine kinase [Arsukibacterium indicum]|uniref:histidine kinase n=1 Tax=Arsukibacterium indicum TaxID=2848612 RepID=A0ABS6MQ76_9GAMM|nr:HAMP domain-containing sensor histidine kinase [Arsukibacterium indicum]MBV2130496.1 HAMP domain-containing histidine kinase [Arsukibacterium indicum]
MYRYKLFILGAALTLVLTVVMVSAALSAHVTSKNLAQSTTAQSLLVEHQQLSSISYRLFKQLTDELLFGKNANQANIRNKQKLIDQSLNKIRMLERQQRDDLGPEMTQGSVEDTEDLARLINTIVSEFAIITAEPATIAPGQREQVRRLLEVTIDNQFRDAINAAVSRQTLVVGAINSRIDTLNSTIIWFSIGLGVVGIPLIVLSCLWLLNQLYQPLQTIKAGTEALAQGRYTHRLPENLDDEFRQLALAFNSMAEKLWQHQQDDQRSRVALESEVQQRTQQLVQANQLLTATDNKRRQFLTDISHELRTPVTIIRGEAQVTLRQTDANQQNYRQALQSVLEQAVAMSRLIDDLLLLARADIGQLKLELAEIDVADWLITLAEQWRSYARSHHFEYRIEESCQLLVLLADESRLSQAIAAILDNAIKYTNAGCTITLTASMKNSLLTITVADNGPGIAPTDLPYIFDRFVRLQRNKDGTGLGLAIAKEIIVAHAGQIDVQSEPAKGTVFNVVLPTEILQ